MLQTAFTFVTKPNNSLTDSACIKVFGFIALVSLGIALGFWYLGAWLVLPFAGLELLGLAWAFYYVRAQQQDYERLTIEGSTLRVEVCCKGKLTVYELNRYWAQIVRGYNCRLALRSHGKEVAVGRFLDCSARAALAAKLKTFLG